MSKQYQTSILITDLCIQKSNAALANCLEIEAKLQKQLQETIDIINNTNNLLKRP